MPLQGARQDEPKRTTRASTQNDTNSARHQVSSKHCELMVDTNPCISFANVDCCFCDKMMQQERNSGSHSARALPPSENFYTTLPLPIYWALSSRKRLTEFVRKMLLCKLITRNRNLTKPNWIYSSPTSSSPAHPNLPQPVYSMRLATKTTQPIFNPVSCQNVVGRQQSGNRDAPMARKYRWRIVPSPAHVAMARNLKVGPEIWICLGLGVQRPERSGCPGHPLEVRK